MKKIGILPNLDKDTDLSVTKRIIGYLLEKGCIPSLTEEVAKKADLLMYVRKKDEIYAHSDFLITLGGDGTLLGVARQTAKYQTPILGINMGNLGFLTAEENVRAEHAIDDVLCGRYKLEERMMLETIVSAEPEKIRGILALNDVCISRGFSSKILEFKVFVNNEYVDTLRADGVIICTPTGSTAYNLSAGGPIMKPDAKIIAITPICPHTLNNRSIIISAYDIITIKVSVMAEENFTVSIDGQSVTALKRENVVQIKRSKYCANIIKTTDLGFYEILRQKLTR